MYVLRPRSNILRVRVSVCMMMNSKFFGTNCDEIKTDFTMLIANSSIEKQIIITTLCDEVLVDGVIFCSKIFDQVLLLLLLLLFSLSLSRSLLISGTNKINKNSINIYISIEFANSMHCQVYKCWIEYITRLGCDFDNSSFQIQHFCLSVFFFRGFTAHLKIFDSIFAVAHTLRLKFFRFYSLYLAFVLPN